MEVSSISPETKSQTNSGALTITTTPTITSTIPATNNTTTTNTNQLLLGNDNLQSHNHQKSPSTITANIIPMNEDNLKTTQSNDVIQSRTLTNNKSISVNNNQSNESKMDNCCLTTNNQFNSIDATIKEQRQSENQKLIKEEREPVDSIVREDSEPQLKRDIELTIHDLLSKIDDSYVPVITATTSQSSIFSSTSEPVTKVALITPVIVEEEPELTKDIVTLRNLEITPPPQPIRELLDEGTPTTTATNTPDIQDPTASKSARKRKVERTQSETTERSEDEVAGGRSKRQRKQTELFQVVTNPTPKATRSKDTDKSTSITKKSGSPAKKNQSKIPRFQPKQSQKAERKSLIPKPQPERSAPDRQTIERQRDFQDVLYYEKNDYLAIRNEENTFYLCQLTENVRVQRPFVKIRWLDTQDNGKTYFLTSHYDKIPQKSIIMPVMLNKLESGAGKGKPIFSIDDQIRETVMERLKRSLNMPTEVFE